jgi:aminoglycoside 3-N-acetyltransferase
VNLLHQISDRLVHALPDEKIKRLRAAYFGLKRKAAPLSRWIHGTFDTDDLQRHLEQQVDPDFEILMVHGSVNGMSPMYTGNALELVRMLIDYCGPERTLVMPAFFFGDPKIGSVTETFAANPRFDLRRTPSQMGLFTEIFRRTKGVVQSRHPVYRVAAFGPLAEALTAGHELASTPAGTGTPFEFMAAHRTRVLGIGKSYHVMTQVHHVDDLLGDSYPASRTPMSERIRTPVVVVDRGEEFPMVLTGGGIQWRFNIDKLPSLLTQGEMRYWKFHNVPLFQADATRVTASLIASAGKGLCLHDPQ